MGISTSKSDSFSFGICLWELFSYGAIPYAGWTNKTVIEQVTAGYRLPKPNCPDEVYTIMLECWEYDPNKRPTFAELHARIVTLSQQEFNEPEFPQSQENNELSLYN